MAGYGSPTTKPEGWAAIGYRLAHDEKIQEAMIEEQEKRIVALAPGALFALENLIANPKHRDHGRAIGIVLDRVAPIETTLHVKREERHVIVDPDKVLARIAEIAKRVGIDPKQLASPAMIDETAIEVPAAAAREGGDDAGD